MAAGHPIPDPENCPQPYWHQTHRYCPCCTWREAPDASMIEQRRKKLADEMAALQNDVDHWNRAHPSEEPIVIDADLTADVAARKEQRSA